MRLHLFRGTFFFSHIIIYEKMSHPAARCCLHFRGIAKNRNSKVGLLGYLFLVKLNNHNVQKHIPI